MDRNAQTLKYEIEVKKEPESPEMSNHEENLIHGHVSSRLESFNNYHIKKELLIDDGLVKEEMELSEDSQNDKIWNPMRGTGGEPDDGSYSQNLKSGRGAVFTEEQNYPFVFINVLDLSEPTFENAANRRSWQLKSPFFEVNKPSIEEKIEEETEVKVPVEISSKSAEASEGDLVARRMNCPDGQLQPRDKVRAFKCPQCHFETRRKDCLKRHLMSHNKTEYFKCSECVYETLRKDCLKRHLLSHNKTHLFKCSQCAYETHKKMHLNKHLDFHKDTKLFKCTKCNFETHRRDCLNMHLVSHDKTKVFKCSECSFVTHRKDCLKKHALAHNDAKLFKCSECDYGTIRKENLKRHLISHNKNFFKCPTCEFETHKKVYMKSHLMSHDKNFCSECDLERKSTIYLKRKKICNTTL